MTYPVCIQLKVATVILSAQNIPNYNTTSGGIVGRLREVEAAGRRD